MRKYRMPFEKPANCDSFSCIEKSVPTNYDVEVLPNPYDSFEAYFNGTPIPSFASEAVYNDIDGGEVTRYCKDTFEAIECLKRESAKQSKADKRSAEATAPASNENV